MTILQLFLQFRKAKKQSLENAYTEGFNNGVSKTWELLLPSVKKSEKLIYDNAMNDAMKNFEPAIDERINKLNSIDVKILNDAIRKRNNFEIELNLTKDEERKKKLKNYIEVLGWILDADKSQD